MCEGAFEEEEKISFFSLVYIFHFGGHSRASDLEKEAARVAGLKSILGDSVLLFSCIVDHQRLKWIRSNVSPLSEDSYSHQSYYHILR